MLKLVVVERGLGLLDSALCIPGLTGNLHGWQKQESGSWVILKSDSGSRWSAFWGARCPLDSGSFLVGVESEVRLSPEVRTFSNPGQVGLAGLMCFIGKDLAGESI
jgi:hypothetical protein